MILRQFLLSVRLGVSYLLDCCGTPAAVEQLGSRDRLA
jgi:hypothetical protein